MPCTGDKGDKNAARPPEGSLVETRCLIKGRKSAIVPFPGPRSGPKSRTGPGAFAKKRATRWLCLATSCKKCSVAARSHHKTLRGNIRKWNRFSCYISKRITFTNRCRICSSPAFFFPDILGTVNKVSLQLQDKQTDLGTTDFFAPWKFTNYSEFEFDRPLFRFK